MRPERPLRNRPLTHGGPAHHANHHSPGRTHNPPERPARCQIEQLQAIIFPRDCDTHKPPHHVSLSPRALHPYNTASHLRAPPLANKMTSGNLPLNQHLNRGKTLLRNCDKMSPPEPQPLSRQSAAPLSIPVNAYQYDHFCTLSDQTTTILVRFTRCRT